jgi:GTP cyclohydrolase I
MSNQHKITHAELRTLAVAAADRITRSFSGVGRIPLRVYPIPRGGVPAALALAQHIPITLVDEPAQAHLFFDDLIDSGATKAKFYSDFPEVPFFALLDKRYDKVYKDRWIVFPWEKNESGSFEDNVIRLLQFVGEDPTRGGLLETPARVAKAWKHWCRGYTMDPAATLKVFEDGAEKHDQMITVKDIPFYSHCEHHMAPIFGTVTIGYVPNGKIVGLSKLSRLAEIFARRLQVQERMTDQIADALFTHLNPLGVGVMVKARHLCMESRGVCQQGHHTITTALRGVLKESADAKAEFLSLAQ